MPLIQIENASKAYGAVPILSDISWNVSQGDRIGLVGRNGCGKTTLFHVLTGEIRPDAGSVNRSRGIRIGYLPQDVTFPLGGTVRETALEGFEEVLALRRRLRDLEQRMADGDHEQSTLDAYSRVHGQYEHLDGYTLEARAEAILHGLGFKNEDHDTLVDVLSGGQRNRLALARLLASQPDLLLLDEPTNHLDLRGIEWLERFLGDYPGTYIVISHDRYFLDRVTREIVDLEHTRIRRYRGNYTAYATQKSLLIAQQEKTWDAQQAYISRTEDYIRKNIAGQKTKQAKSRRKQLQKIERVDRPRSERVTSVKFSAGPRGGDRVFQAESLCKAYGDKVLFKDLDFIGWRGDRIGVVGPNGTGKSTLIKLLTGQVAADSGRITLGRNIEIGYYDQDRVDLNPDNTVIQEVWSVSPDATVTEMRTFLGAFLFSGDEVDVPISSLSGGEQSRVALAKLVRRPVNLLVLDEPTNHLDIPSRIVLERALREYPGTIITVSHDRYFLNDIVTRLILVEEEGWRVIDGDYETLAKLWNHGETKTPPKNTKSVDTNTDSQEEKRQARERDKQRRRAGEVESELAQIEADIEKIDAELNREDLATDWPRLKELAEEKQEMQARMEQRFAEWESIESSLKEAGT